MRKNKDTNTPLLPLQILPKYKWPDDLTTSIPPKGLLYGFDLETKGLDPYKANAYILTAALADEEKGYVFPVRFHRQAWCAEHLQVLRELVEDDKVTLVGHNINKFDLKWLAVHYGWTLRCNTFDTMLAAYFIDENDSASLDNCVARYLGKHSHKGMVNTSALEGEALSDVLIYNGYDAQTELELMRRQVTLLHAEGIDKLAAVANKATTLLTRMEVHGIAIDKPWATATEKKLIDDCITAKVKLNNAGFGGFNPDSDKDVRRILYNNIGFAPTKFTESGAPSVDTEALNDLLELSDDPAHYQFIDSLKTYSKNMKLLTTYYQPVDRWLAYDSRVHTSFSLGKQYDGAKGGTVTGRLSSSNPNLQNIPRGQRHRGMFVPSSGYKFIDGDFSQLELRIVAYLSQEPVMIQAFEQGYDIHTAVMSDLLGYDYNELVKLLDDSKNPKYDELKSMRVAIKRINFGIVYGVGANRLQRLIKTELNILKAKEWCQDMIDQWLRKYQYVADWLERQRQFAIGHKFVRMPFGQKRRLPDAADVRRLPYDMRGPASRALRQATNFPVQCMASWTCLIGMLLVSEYFNEHPETQGHLVLQVHDSVLSEVISTCNLQQVAEDIKYIMEHRTVQFMQDVFNINFNVPLSFPTEVLDRWK